MRNVMRMGMVVALVMASFPVFAGEGHKCTASTQECLDYMVSTLKNKGWVGIETDDESMRISRVVDGSPAETAGFRVGDILVAANGVEYKTGSEEKLKSIKESMTPGTKMTFTVERAGARKDLAVTLADLPDRIRAQWVGNHMMEHASIKLASN